MATQEEIPGTESQERIPELHALAVELYDLQEKRKKATSDEQRRGQRPARPWRSTAGPSTTWTAGTSTWTANPR